MGSLRSQMLGRFDAGEVAAEPVAGPVSAPDGRQEASDSRRFGPATLADGSGGTLGDLPGFERPLVLSIFPGADLLGRGFEAEGCCVVRGPDLVWGGDVRTFHPPAGRFAGVIGGSPCQDFSKIRRAPPSGQGVALLEEFGRVVAEAAPEWWLLENVPGVPDLVVPGYSVQRFNLAASECGCRQRRLRRFQFGSRDGSRLTITRRDTSGPLEPAALATEGTKLQRRGWSDFCALQGLPRAFDLPGLSTAAKYRAVGNGVPIPMARVLAAAVLRRRVTVGRLCVCDCGRPVTGRAVTATAACRKRMERRRRDAAGVTEPGPVTGTRTQCDGSRHGGVGPDTFFR